MIRILVPLDGSAAAESAISHASAIARTFSAEIELFSAVVSAPQDRGSSADSVNWHLAKRQRQNYLDAIAESLSDTAKSVVTTVCDGDPARAILQQIDDSEIDLLVIARYGEGNATQFEAGGTAHKVLCAANVGVLLVDPQFVFDAERGYKNILVTVEDSRQSEWSACFAAMVAQTFGGSVELLQVIEAPRLPSFGPTSPAQQRILDSVERAARSQASLRLGRLTERIRENVEASSYIVVSSDVASTIKEIAAAHKSDLLVATAQREYADKAGYYGPTCESLLTHMHRPLLVLRTEPAGLSTSHFQSVYLNSSHADVG